MADFCVRYFNPGPGRKRSRGIYEESRVKLPNRSLLPRYFQKGLGEWSGHYRVKRHLREQIDFRHMNLLHPERTEESTT